MDIEYSLYQLTPLRKANRLSSLEPKTGVYLKTIINGRAHFADYFPHLPLGDRGHEQFLEEFKNQHCEYDQKVLALLKKDRDYQNHKSVTFKNHQLWTGSEEITAPVVKYKMMTPTDSLFLSVLERGSRLRLDSNAIFGRSSYLDFLKTIPQELHSLIDYVEDPIREKDWSGLPVPSAQDFIASESFDFYIYKPNCEFIPQTQKPIIFSAYLGSNLGNWHTYCEMVDSADLNLTHGIIGKNFYQEEGHFMLGNYLDGFYPDLKAVNNIYHSLHQRNWKQLCSM